ncbi:MAG: helix-turn-helix transcriptional regulator [Verrucomicrobiia bacterium]
MNDPERQICSRLKELRERRGDSQWVFAAMLSVSRDRLAGIECGRTPLRIETAIRLAEITGCNLNWLADGTGPVNGPLPSSGFVGQIPPRCLFSRAWQVWLKAALGPAAKQFGEPVIGGGGVGGATVQDYLDEEIAGILKHLPSEFHWNFFAHVTKAGRDFVKTNLAAINRARAGVSNRPENNLTEPESRETLAENVKPQLPSLLDRLNRATKEAGKMSALAKHLAKAMGRKVPLASVSRWLSGKREPGGEITLLLERWVKLQEERQK